MPLRNVFPTGLNAALRGCLTGCLSLIAPALMAQEAPQPGLCDWILERYAVSVNVDGTATDFLHNTTDVLDILFGEASASAPEAPFRELYPTGGAPPTHRLDLRTRGASRLDGGCLQVDAWLVARDTNDQNKSINLTQKRDQPYKVSVFAFDTGHALAAARLGTSIASTSVRIAVGDLELSPYEDGQPPPSDDPMRDLGIAVYDQDRPDLPTVGSVDRTRAPLPIPESHRWFPADLGDGPQLVAVVCRPNCPGLLTGLPAIPRFATAPDPTKAAPNTNDLSDSSPEDFTGETLFVTRGGVAEPVKTLETETDTFTPEARTALRRTLEALRSTDEPKRQIALSHLEKLGLINKIPDAAVLRSYTISHAIVLTGDPETPPEPQPEIHLSSVRLDLAEPQPRSVVSNCVAILEITHPAHSPITRQLSFVRAETGSSFASQFTGMQTTLGEEEDILKEPLDELTLRIFIRESEGKPAPSCKLDWQGIFPDSTYVLPATGADLYSVSATGAVVFSDVRLSSTRRPVYLLLHNKTGALDSNGQPLNAALYPSWNAKPDQTDLDEALNILAQAALATYDKSAGGIFTVAAQDPVSKGFGVAEPLTTDRQKEPVTSLVPGDFGVESLEQAIRKVERDSDVAARLLVLGRSGLPAGTEYCGTPPKAPAAALPGMVVIDFVPIGAPDARAPEIEDATGAGYPPDVATALGGFSAARCPSSEGQPYDHWVFIPDNKRATTWRHDLKTLARFIFEDNK